MTDSKVRKRSGKKSVSSHTSTPKDDHQSSPHQKQRIPPAATAARTWLRIALCILSALLFILAWLTFRNAKISNRKQDPARPNQAFVQKHLGSSSSREPWGGGGQKFFPSTARETSLPFSLPPIRQLPEHRSMEADQSKQDAILNAFAHSWSAYRRDAWGYDEYHPISKRGSNLNDKPGNGIGYTIVDTLDTLILMGLKEDYEAARDWVRDELSWDVPGRMNVFETTIRTLGGLLSAAALIRNPPHPAFAASEEDAKLFVGCAIELADRLLPAFDTPSGLPLREVDLETGEAFGDASNNNSSSLAEATTIQLEFKYLAHLTDEIGYWHTAERPMTAVRRAAQYAPNLQGLLPIFLNPMAGTFYNGEVRLGSRGDSYYEYLIKQWLQTGRTEQVYRDMWDISLKGIKRILTKPSVHSTPPLLFTAELTPRRSREGKMYMQLVPKQDHLVCFLGGSMMLGATSLEDVWGDKSHHPIPPISDNSVGNIVDKEDWRVGHEFIRTCVDTYTKTKTGLSPEIAHFRTPNEPNITDAVARSLNRAPVPRNVDWYIKKPPPAHSGVPLIDARNILRPETVESLFIAFHLTGDQIYRDWGWQIFQAFEKHCRVESGGYSSIDDVNSRTPQQVDKMETFWLSETLKYLYLLFSDQTLLPLSEWVLNTEAHPLPVFVPRFPTGVR